MNDWEFKLRLAIAHEELRNSKPLREKNNTEITPNKFTKYLNRNQSTKESDADEDGGKYRMFAKSNN